MGKIAGGEERIGGSEKELAIKNPAGRAGLSPIPQESYTMTETESTDATVFACLLHRFEDQLSADAFAKTSKIQEHIIRLSVRKLAAARDEKRAAFYTICTEQQKLAIEGVKIINHDLQQNHD